ncbi:MAG: hypothetical protein K5871_04620 [Lachnospiraceae bacterium]|nr:hypothetical protein [Lachnospiraceae bacterium]
MAETIEYKRGQTITEAGSAMTSLGLVISGRVAAVYPGGAMMLERGDVIGITEVVNEVHFLGYKTVTDTSVVPYPYSSMDNLENLMSQHMDFARVSLCSMFKQITGLLGQCQISEIHTNDLLQKLAKDVSFYEDLCRKLRIKAKEVSGVTELDTYMIEESSDTWLADYYAGLCKLYQSETGKNVTSDISVTMGMLRKGSLDARKAYQLLDNYYSFRQELGSVYFKPEGNDLHEYLTETFFRLKPGSADSIELNSIITRIGESFFDEAGLDDPAYQKRLSEYEEKAGKIMESAAESEQASDADEWIMPEELTDSLDKITAFCGAESEEVQNFKAHIMDLRNVDDPESIDDDVSDLRRFITKEFFQVYKIAFFRSLEIKPTLPVLMFLYFGFVDEVLAGRKYTAVLSGIAQGLSGSRGGGIYTFYDWLKAIHSGTKDPSRDEFDTDYNDTIHKLKVQNKIDAEEEKKRLADGNAKAVFEMDNFFRSADKVTYGRITTFCPVFLEKTCIKDPASTLVDRDVISDALDRIRKVDYTAYYRESLDQKHMDVMGKETIHLEYLPDFILMPNMGTRAVMWQEIEGKLRNSPSRMAISIFHAEDMLSTMIRLTGDFRWEMCKRVQGARWNDVTEHSLTSEYFDYVQFYRKNRDLSPEIKERIRTSLQRAKNSFKEMFIRDYMLWVQYESNGSPRLNKIARQILYNYCPFNSELAARNRTNPIYTEMIDRGELKKAQKLHRLEQMEKKLKNSGHAVPETLTEEISFISGKVKL